MFEQMFHLFWEIRCTIQLCSPFPFTHISSYYLSILLQRLQRHTPMLQQRPSRLFPLRSAPFPLIPILALALSSPVSAVQLLVKTRHFPCVARWPFRLDKHKQRISIAIHKNFPYLLSIP